MTRWAVGVAVAVMVLATTGCDDSSIGLGGGNKNNDDTGPSTPIELTNALLTVQDLPQGWKVDRTPLLDTPGGAEPPQCSNLFESIDSAPIAETAVSLTNGPSFVSHIVTYYGEDASKRLDDFADTIAQCANFTAVDEGARLDMSTGAVPFPNFGDRTEAARVVSRRPGGSLVIDAVMVSVGEFELTLLTGGLGTVDPAEIERLARLATDRLRTTTNGG